MASTNEGDGIRFRPDVVDAVAQGSAKVRASLEAIQETATSFVRMYGTIAAEFADAATMAATNATVVEQLQAAISYFQVATGKRIAELMFGIIQALNQRKLGLASLATRSLLEVTAVVSYTEMGVETRLQTGVASDEDLKKLGDLLDTPVRGGRFDWGSLLRSPEGLPRLLDMYASNPRSAQVAGQVSAWTRIEQLDRWIAKSEPAQKDHVLFAYDLLSDICHPSVGSYLTYIAPERREGWYGFDPLPSDDVLRQFCLWTITPLVETLGRLDTLRPRDRSLEEGVVTAPAP